MLLNATNLPKFRKRIVELVCVLVAEIRINPLRFCFRDNRFEWNTRIAQFLFVLVNLVLELALLVVVEITADSRHRDVDILESVKNFLAFFLVFTT